MACTFDTPCASVPYAEDITVTMDPENRTGSRRYVCQSRTCARDKWEHPEIEVERVRARGMMTRQCVSCKKPMLVRSTTQKRHPACAVAFTRSKRLGVREGTRPATRHGAQSRRKNAHNRALAGIGMGAQREGVGV